MVLLKAVKVTIHPIRTGRMWRPVLTPSMGKLGGQSYNFAPTLPIEGRMRPVLIETLRRESNTKSIDIEIVLFII